MFTNFPLFPCRVAAQFNLGMEEMGYMRQAEAQIIGDPVDQTRGGVIAMVKRFEQVLRFSAGFPSSEPG